MKDNIFMGEISEIKDFIDMNNIDSVAKYIYDLEKQCDKLQKGLAIAREMLNNRVTKDRYNDLVKKYNKLLKDNK